MLRALQKHWECLQTRKERLLAELNSASEIQLHYRPDSTAWSLLEVSHHLLLTEEAWVRATRASLHGGPGRIVTLRESFMALIVLAVMRSSIRLRTPAGGESVLPDRSSTLSGICTQWEKVRHRMGKLLEQLPESESRTGVFKHPVSGFLTPQQSIRFLDAHFAHHEPQIKRLLQSFTQ